MAEKKMPRGRSFSELTAEERHAMGLVGGKASGEARRRNKSMRDALKQCLTMTTPDRAQADYLQSLGLDPTILNAIAMAVMGKGTSGDVDAVRLIRDTIGERPTEVHIIQPTDSTDLSALSDAELDAMLNDENP